MTVDEARKIVVDFGMQKNMQLILRLKWLKIL